MGHIVEVYRYGTLLKEIYALHSYLEELLLINHRIVILFGLILAFIVRFQ